MAHDIPIKKLTAKTVKENVKNAYGKIATGERKGCGCTCDSCGPQVIEFARSIGYTEEELKVIPAEANLGLSCGNPTALASLKEGETVLDLGSGAGFDCFLAASKVGPKGRVIGVDMTLEMIEKARSNAQKSNISNVEFRLGEIEHLPITDESVDVIISNCVINLSDDKPKVFREMYRVLKRGGRIAISDIALLRELPQEVRASVEAYVGCVAGAILVDEYRAGVAAAGFVDISVTVKGSSSCIDPDTNDPMGRALFESVDPELLRDSVVSVYVEAQKL